MERKPRRPGRRTTTSTTTSTTTTAAPNALPLVTWNVLVAIVKNTDLPHASGPTTMPAQMLTNALTLANRFASDMDTLTNHRLRVVTTVHECQTPSYLERPAPDGGYLLHPSDVIPLFAAEGVDPNPYDGIFCLCSDDPDAYATPDMGETYNQYNVTRSGGYSFVSIDADPAFGTGDFWNILCHEFTHQVDNWYWQWDATLPNPDDRYSYTWPDGSPMADAETVDTATHDWLFAYHTRQCKKISDGRLYGMTDALWRQPHPRS